MSSKARNQRWRAPARRQDSQSFASFPLLPNHEKINVPVVGQHKNSRDIQGITAVLPLTADSLNDLKSNLDSILSTHSSNLYEIIIGCSLGIAVKTERALNQTRLSLTTSIPITVLPWSQTDLYSFGMLHILPSVFTPRVLLLELTALRQVDEPTRMILLDSISSDFPVGPHGVLISPFNVSCINSRRHTVPAAYLVPPFLAPTSLLIQAENGMRLDTDTWAALGDRIVKTNGARFGGLVFSSLNKSYGWCTHARKSFDTVSSHAFLQSFYDTLELSVRDGLSVPPRLSILLSGREELKSFGSTICEAAHRGYVLRIMVFSWPDSTPFSHFAFDVGCHLHFRINSHDSSNTSLANQLKAWILPDDTDVLLYASESLAETMAIEASAETFRLTGGTVVHIPVADLPFCDWMAMLDVSEWQNWHKPRVDLSVITNDRPRSLLRLLDSLTAARYFGDNVQMKINLDQTADTETRHIAADFRWALGFVHVQHRIIAAGLLPAVVESWYPHDNDSYGVLLEDDVEVSPLFYAWIKITILKYRYGPSRSHARSLFGISLYQPRNLELRVPGRVPFNPRILFAEHKLPDLSTPYLSQVPCSWGAVYFPEHFREFHDYLALRLSEATHNISEIIVPDIRSNRWTRSWKKYFNELVYLRGYTMLYPNYDFSLATNHVEIGAHVKKDPERVSDYVRKQYDVPLMPLPSLSGFLGRHSIALLDLPNNSLPLWDDLPVLDLWGKVTTHKELLRRGYERHELISGCLSLKDSVQFTYDASKLLCSITVKTS